MRIDPKNLNAVYETQLKNNTNNTSREKVKSDKLPEDRIELSKEYKNRSSLGGIKSSVVSDIDKGASLEKLQRIKVDIGSGTYHVDSGKIADAILGGSKDK